jgi:hypothetical protein
MQILAARLLNPSESEAPEPSSVTGHVERQQTAGVTSASKTATQYEDEDEEDEEGVEKHQHTLSGSSKALATVSNENVLRDKKRLQLDFKVQSLSISVYREKEYADLRSCSPMVRVFTQEF